MANEYADNIRRIARGDRRRGGLSQQGERDAIESGSVPLLTNAEIAELNNEQQTPSSNAPENEDKDPEDEEQQDNIDPNDPNSFYRGAQSGSGSQTDEGTYDVGDVIDGTGNAPGSAPGSSGTQNSGALRELTGLKDCETDTPFNLHMDGNFIPPEGWEDPETPPTLDDWEEGYYWLTPVVDELNDDGCTRPAEQTGKVFSKSQAVAIVDKIHQQNIDYGICRGRGPYRDGPLTDTDTSYIKRLERFNSGSWSSVGTLIANRRSCDNDFDILFCPLEAPQAESQWPQDDTYDLAIKDGQLQTSEFDADKPRDEALGTKPFCFGDGRTGNAHVTADGGLMVYETGENGAPLPGAAARVYDSAGDFRAAGDATETFINQYLPK